MKKLLMILLMTLLIVSCASTKEFSYPLNPETDRPQCDPEEIVIWYLLDTEDNVGWEYIDDPAPDGAMPYSIEIEMPCFRKMELWRKKLELRVERGGR